MDVLKDVPRTYVFHLLYVFSTYIQHVCKTHLAVWVAMEKSILAVKNGNMSYISAYAAFDVLKSIVHR